MAEDEAWREFVGQVVVVDTDSHFVHIGTLREVRDHFLVLAEVDAHDTRQSTSTKEQYIMDTKRFGVKANRRETAVRKSMIVSVSKLDDVVLY